MMSHEEFVRRAREAPEPTAAIGRHMRSLYQEDGVLPQVVQLLLKIRTDLQESLSRNLIVSDDTVKAAIGLQGQIMGVDTTLAAILEMINTEEVEDERNTEPERRAP